MDTKAAWSEAMKGRERVLNYNDIIWIQRQTASQTKFFLKRVMNYVKIIWIQRTGKDKGKLMKELMVRVKGKADGKMVNKVVSEYCK